MNSNHKVAIIGKNLRPLCAAMLVFGALTVSSHAQVDSRTLSAGATSAMVDVGSSLGMYNWVVGGVNQLNQQWFYYRVGSGQQYSIDTAPSRIATLTAANALTTTYYYGAFNIQVDYTLNDVGSGKASIDESVIIHNNTSSAISDFHFFQYSDFNLGGIPGGDTISVDNYSAYQQKGALAIAEGIIDPEATLFEANTTGSVNSTLYRLTHNPGVNLTGADSASGDVTWAYQWDLTIETTADTVLLKNKSLTVTPVPEPSALAFLALGLGLLGLAKRR